MKEVKRMGMKYLSILLLAIISLALQAQTGTPGSTAPPNGAMQQEQATGAAQTAKPLQATAVAAELTKRIDTKNAKQGDEVAARTTMAAKLPDGTELPSGTKLTGKVTDVKAKTKEDKSSHLAFNLDHAVLKGGKEVPVVVIVTSVTGPQGPSNDVMLAGGGATGVPGGSPGAAAATGTSAPPTASAPMVTSTGQAQSSAGGALKNAQDRVPVGNMPGVILSASPGTAGTLDSEKDNISLASGTKLTLNVASGASPVGQ
jgi:hypothetical protein